MPNPMSRLVSACPVFVSPDVRATVAFYTEKLGFRAAKHYDKIESFATLYRDEIELVIVQAGQGAVESNFQRYGAGYDAYIDTAAPEGIEAIYAEFKNRGVKIVAKPHKTAYGTYELVIEDCDGRRIGFGRIYDAAVYFADADRGLGEPK